jgi:hypothetical protein
VKNDLAGQPIDKTQIKLIHVAKHELRLDNDGYRTVLRALFRVETSKDLTYAQATEFIDHLQKLGFKIKSNRVAPPCAHCAPRPKRDAIPDNAIYLVSPQQLYKIEHLSQDIKWKFHDGFQRWLRKYFNIERVRLSMEASMVIEALKNMLKDQNHCRCPWNEKQA